VSALDERLPMRAESLRTAAWAGLTDSMPRAALLSIHARVEHTQTETWDAPALVQVWGPRFSAYAVAVEDLPIFTLGRLPGDGKARQRAEDMATRLADLIGDGSMPADEAGRALGAGNAIRYATTTGTVAIRWDGARQPTIWIVPAPDMAATEARLELARRYLHVLGPGTPAGFAKWAGVTPRRGPETFEALGDEVVPVTTPVGEGWILARDEAAFRDQAGEPAPVRLLPSGDTFFLYWGAARELLVPDEGRRSELWTSRVWPGAVLVEGEIAGVWRRQQGVVTIHPWRRLTPVERSAVEAEATALPLPDVDRVGVVWR
jgi:hypothetical protein